MAFGSYDESEQEQPDREEKDLGLDRTTEVRNWRTGGKEFEGESEIELGDEEKLFENLR
jgi:hypothetical protein